MRIHSRNRVSSKLKNIISLKNRIKEISTFKMPFGLSYANLAHPHQPPSSASNWKIEKVLVKRACPLLPLFVGLFRERVGPLRSIVSKLLAVVIPISPG